MGMGEENRSSNLPLVRNAEYLPSPFIQIQVNISIFETNTVSGSIVILEAST